MGELLRAVTMSEATFSTEQVKSKGMNEHNVTIALNENLKLVQTVFETANVSLIQSAEPDIFRYIYFKCTIQEKYKYVLFISDLQAKL